MAGQFKASLSKTYTREGKNRLEHERSGGKRKQAVENKRTARRALEVSPSIRASFPQPSRRHLRTVARGKQQLPKRRAGEGRKSSLCLALGETLGGGKETLPPRTLTRLPRRRSLRVAGGGPFVTPRQQSGTSRKRKAGSQMGTGIKKTPSFPSTKEPAASAEALPGQFSLPLPAEPGGEGRGGKATSPVGFKAPPPSRLRQLRAVTLGLFLARRSRLFPARRSPRGPPSVRGYYPRRQGLQVDPAGPAAPSSPSLGSGCPLPPLALTPALGRAPQKLSLVSVVDELPPLGHRLAERFLLLLGHSRPSQKRRARDGQDGAAASRAPERRRWRPVAEGERIFRTVKKLPLRRPAGEQKRGKERGAGPVTRTELRSSRRLSPPRLLRQFLEEPIAARVVW